MTDKLTIMDSFSMYVQPRMMEAAITLFVQQFQWEELPGKQVRSAPYHAGQATLQLVEMGAPRFFKKSWIARTVRWWTRHKIPDETWIFLENGDEIIFYVRPVFNASWAMETAQIIQEWAGDRNMECLTKKIPNSSDWTVYVPALFPVAMILIDKYSSKNALIFSGRFKLI